MTIGLMNMIVLTIINDSVEEYNNVDNSNDSIDESDAKYDNVDDSIDQSFAYESFVLTTVTIAFMIVLI